MYSGEIEMKKTVCYTKGDKMFEVSEKPKGHIVDPTDIVITDDGVFMPVWRQTDETYKRFSLKYVVVILLESAIRMCRHILDSYKQEITDIHEIERTVVYAQNAYLDAGHLNDDLANELINVFEDMYGVRLPEKKEAQKQIGESLSSKDHLGRHNPCSKAARLLSALFRIQSVRSVNIRVIIAQMYARKGLLEMTLEENLSLLEKIEKIISRILAEPRFKNPDFASSLTYNRTITELKKLTIDIDMLWGAPYDAFGRFILPKLGEAIRYLEKHHHLLALKSLREIRVAYKVMRDIPLKTYRALRASRYSNWKEKPKNAILRIEHIRDDVLEYSPEFLAPWTLAMEATLTGLISELIVFELTKNPEKVQNCIEGALRRSIISMPQPLRKNI